VGQILEKIGGIPGNIIFLAEAIKARNTAEQPEIYYPLKMRLVEYYGASKWDLSLHTDRSLSKTPYRELFLRAVNGKPIKLLRKLGTGANAPTVTEAESSGLFHLAQIPPPRKFMLDSQHRYRIEIPLANLELMSLLDKQLVTVLSDWKRKSVEVTFLSSHL